jgi:two-component system, chemotaxis family, protein-glutamate methylesterase/glutaminase
MFHQNDELVFSPDEVELIFEIATKITGNCHVGNYRKNILVANVHRRMLATGIRNPSEYLDFATQDEDERAWLVSALTIHTTNWFREKPQFDQLFQYLIDNKKTYTNKKIKIAITACSTGEEAYTLAMYLEDAKKYIVGFDYAIFGTDIDPISVQTAQKAIYPQTSVTQIPPKYQTNILVGSGRTEGFITIKKYVRERCSFKINSIKDFTSPEAPFDMIFCRNVLIYFTPADVEKIVRSFVSHLSPDGILCLGHSESIEAKNFNVARLGHAIYKYSKHINATDNGTSIRAVHEKKILIVDDSQTIRTVMTSMFKSHGFQTFAVESAQEASEFLSTNKVDIISLDLHMPNESGDKWLRTQRRNGLKTPVVILSDLSPAQVPDILDTLQKDAQEYIEKKYLRKDPAGTVAKFDAILESSHMSSKPDTTKQTVNLKSSQKLRRADMILIGASTGGTKAIAKILENIPRGCPPIVIVQHMGLEFLRPFAETVANGAHLKLGDVVDGAELKRGCVYLATGDFHIGIGTKSARDHTLVLKIDNSSSMNGHRPSVDFLFHSAAKLPSSIAAFILTGMGRDGAKGLLALREQGAMTFAQDQSSCVVFGMPKEAINLGAAQYVGNLDEMKLKLEHIISISFDFERAS